MENKTVYNPYDTLVSFETAKLAKEKGFDWKTIDIWSFDIPPWKDEDYCVVKEWFHHTRTYLDDVPYHEPWYYSPTLSHLQKWLREVHNYHIEIHMIPICPTYNYSIVWIFNGVHCKTGDGYKSYEEALEAGLIETLNLIK